MPKPLLPLLLAIAMPLFVHATTPPGQRLKQENDAVLRSIALRSAWALYDSRTTRNFEWGRYFLEWETAASGKSIHSPEFDKNLETYRSLVKQVVAEQNEPLIARMDSIRKILLTTALKRYCKKNDDLRSVLAEGGCGNCLSETLMIVSVLKDAHADFEGFDLGVQVFTNHIQAVLVRQSDERLIVFKTGAQQPLWEQQGGYVLVPKALFWMVLNKMAKISPEAAKGTSDYQSIDYRNQKLTIRFPHHIVDLPLAFGKEVLFHLGVPTTENSLYTAGVAADSVTDPGIKEAENQFTATDLDRISDNEFVTKQASTAAGNASKPNANSSIGGGWSSFLGIGSALANVDTWFTGHGRQYSKEDEERIIKELVPRYRELVATATPDVREAFEKAFATNSLGKIRRTAAYYTGQPDQLIGIVNSKPRPLSDYDSIPLPPKVVFQSTGKFQTLRYLNDRDYYEVSFPQQSDVVGYEKLPLKERWTFLGNKIEQAYINLYNQPAFNELISGLKNGGVELMLDSSQCSEVREWLRDWRDLNSLARAMISITTSTGSTYWDMAHPENNTLGRFDWKNPDFYILQARSGSNQYMGYKPLTRELILALQKFAGNWKGRHADFLQNFTSVPDERIISAFDGFEELKAALDMAFPKVNDDTAQAMDFEKSWMISEFSAHSLRQMNERIWGAEDAISGRDFEAVKHPLGGILAEMLTDPNTEYRISPRLPPSEAAEQAEQKPIDLTAKDDDDRAGAKEKRPDPMSPVPGRRDTKAEAADVDLVSQAEFDQLLSEHKKRAQIDQLIAQRKVQILPLELVVGLLRAQPIDFLSQPIIQLLMYPMMDSTLMVRLVENMQSPVDIKVANALAQWDPLLLVRSFAARADSSPASPPECRGLSVYDCYTAVTRSVETHPAPLFTSDNPFLKWAYGRFQSDDQTADHALPFNFSRIVRQNSDFGKAKSWKAASLSDPRFDDINLQHVTIQGYNGPETWSYALRLSFDNGGAEHPFAQSTEVSWASIKSGENTYFTMAGKSKDSFSIYVVTGR